MEVITRWIDPTIEEQRKEIERLNKMRLDAIKCIKDNAWYEYREDAEIISTVAIEEVLKILGDEEDFHNIVVEKNNMEEEE